MSRAQALDQLQLRNRDFWESKSGHARIPSSEHLRYYKLFSKREQRKKTRQHIGHKLSITQVVNTSVKPTFRLANIASPNRSFGRICSKNKEFSLVRPLIPCEQATCETHWLIVEEHGRLKVAAEPSDNFH